MYMYNVLVYMIPKPDIHMYMYMLLSTYHQNLVGEGSH